jgi:hypothetical protein|tara:strand:- start:461 stop:874 length:414 start_codon:yes stop_codon:yes gene_type:complete
MASSNIINFAKNIVHRKKMNEQTIEDAHGNSFLEVIDVVKPQSLKPSTPIPAVSNLDEVVTLQRQHGNVYQVVFSWRGKIYGMKIFFPQVKRLTRKEVNEAIQKIYPNATLRTYFVTGLKYGEPYINVNVGDWSGTK